MCSLLRGGALLTLAIFAFSSDVTEARAQSDRSRHRGPIRSVPVAADIKRDNEFDCPEEFGYYPHPTDCSQYYVCVFGGALLESCTGGLMYSHELQTCDWPRNVGCATSAAAAESELSGNHEPAPRRPSPLPPPLPRAQPNPVVTSRGHPVSRDGFVKQQDIYSDIDELPPAEEIESDRSQRLHRGQPPTIGQVQRDRDGYSSQISSDRNLNSNLVPEAITRTNGKVGSFSFGTQIDQRRTAVPTPAQQYRVEPTESVTPVPVAYSPRPDAGRALYNGSQNYSPDQFDPYYAVYDEDGELYKDNDYVQQYNIASLRPAVQQTYRGTPPPPSRRPQQDVYTPKPVSVDDYDDALIQGQIDDQNQYQTPIRQSTRSTTDESTNRRTNAPATKESSINKETSDSLPKIQAIPVNISVLAKPFQKTGNSLRLAHLFLPNTPVTFHNGIRTNFSTPQSKIETLLTGPVTNNRNNRYNFSLTTGFSIRRSNNSEIPYTLTVITRPSTEFQERKQLSLENYLGKYNYDRIPLEDTETAQNKDLTEEFEFPQGRVYEPVTLSPQNLIHLESTTVKKNFNFNKSELISLDSMESKSNNSSEMENTNEYKHYPRAYLKTIIKRPAPFPLNDENKIVLTSTNNEKWIPLIDRAFEIYQRLSTTESSISEPVRTALVQPKYSSSNKYNDSKYLVKFQKMEPSVSSFASLKKIGYESEKKIQGIILDTVSPTESLKRLLTSKNIYRKMENNNDRLIRAENYNQNIKGSLKMYPNYHEIIEEKTEAFDAINKQISEPKFYETTTPYVVETYEADIKRTDKERRILNIGLRENTGNDDTFERMHRNNRRLDDLSVEPKPTFITDYQEDHKETPKNYRYGTGYLFDKILSSTSRPSTHPQTFIQTSAAPDINLTTPTPLFNYDNLKPSEESLEYTTFTSKFDRIIQEAEANLESYVSKPRKFKEYFDAISRAADKNVDILSNDVGTELTQPMETLHDRVSAVTTLVNNDTINKTTDEMTTTTLMTINVLDSTMMTSAKTTPFPTRASRVNPAIKLAATNPGAGRRSYQSSSKCSTDNSLQVNPKCNEIRYQRYTIRLPADCSQNQYHNNRYLQSFVCVVR